MTQHSGEKTEKATPQRLLKARREGKVAVSREFVSGLQFTVFVMLLVNGAERFFIDLKLATRNVFSQAFSQDLNSGAMVAILHQSFAQTLYPLAATSGILVVTGLAFQLTSTGFALSLKGLVPKSSSFNPFEKLKAAPQK